MVLVAITDRKTTTARGAPKAATRTVGSNPTASPPSSTT
jgi:hypothetical protein